MPAGVMLVAYDANSPLKLISLFMDAASHSNSLGGEIVHSNNKRRIAMQTFVMLSRLSSDAARSPQALEELEQKAMARMQDCPDVEWLESYAVLGGCDYVDIFRAEDLDQRAASRR